jgi:hypothetical protein
MPITPLIDLAQAKSALNMTSTSNDDEITAYILAATEIINRECGYSAPTTFTETTTGRVDASGQMRIVLQRTPVLSVSSITTQMIGLPPIDLTYVTMNPSAGTLYFKNWYAFYGPLVVTYVAGRDLRSRRLCKTACAIIVQDLWQTQRGAVPLPTAAVDESGPQSSGIPYRALQLMRMAPYDGAPGIA